MSREFSGFVPNEVRAAAIADIEAGRAMGPDAVDPGHHTRVREVPADKVAIGPAG